MYNHLLDTFIKVADTGSFSSAANELFISTAAVIKKINQLENSYNIVLFERSNHGVKLTPEGEQLYHDATFMKMYSDLALARIRSHAPAAPESHVITIGKSDNTPCDLLLQLWPRIHKYHPELKLNIVSFDNSTDNVNEMFKNLGSEIDAYIGLFDERMLRLRKCQGMKLKDEPLKIAVPVMHHLAASQVINPEDLENERLMMPRLGRFQAYDDLRGFLHKNEPSIEIVECETIRLSTFNDCFNMCCPLVSLEPWKDIHPLFRTIPANWDFTTPFGIVYAEKPSLGMNIFLAAVSEIAAS